MTPLTHITFLIKLNSISRLRHQITKPKIYNLWAEIYVG